MKEIVKTNLPGDLPGSINKRLGSIEFSLKEVARDIDKIKQQIAIPYRTHLDSDLKFNMDRSDNLLADLRSYIRYAHSDIEEMLRKEYEDDSQIL